MRWIAIIAGLLCAPAWAANLLANPGFEDLDRTMPARWYVYVAPMEGAIGELDATTSHEGRFSVKLHNAQEYEKEPANNWSQNIIENLGGRELLVRGFIKTKEATEAAIWLQCCTKRPWRVLHFATTSADYPRYGTSDWAPVEMRVTPPQGTDFITVRCVLKGRGTAWFDAITVDDEPPEAPELVPGAQADAGPPEDETKPSSGLSAAAAKIDEAHEREMKLLVDAYEAMLEANHALSDTNAALANRLERVSGEVAALRERMLKDGTASEPPSLDEIKRRLDPQWMPSPFVPHGHSQEQRRE